MKTTIRFALVAAGAALLMGSAATGSMAACVKAGGEGTGVTKDFATFMAEAALKNSISNAGMTGKGKVSTSCKPDMTMLLTTCTARQTACK
jgi:hypothetical protein